jgi:hypothetical protein
MADLHDLLERESERYTLPASAAERMFERGRRRGRNRRLAALGVGVILFVAVLAIIRSGLPGADSEPTPAVPNPVTPRSIAGTYVVRLSPEDPGVQLLQAQGRFEMRLSADGVLKLTSPRNFGLPGDPSTFEIIEGSLTTDALVGSECDAPGTYRVSLEGGVLTLAPIEEPCELRRIVLASRPWTSVESEGTSDSLEGEWTATFSCERMVGAVRRAPVAAEVEAFWKAALADQYAEGPIRPEDLTDPCRDVPEPLVRMFRFADGRLQIFDPPDLQEGFDGSYVIRGDTITISDGSDRNIDGRYRVAFRVDGDSVTFDLLGRAASDAFFVGAWESAPFVRTS